MWGLKFCIIVYCWTDLKVPEAEAYEILRVASLGSGLEQPDKHMALVNANAFLCSTIM